MGSPKRLQRAEVTWVDIEQDAGWGEGSTALPVVIQIGYIHAYPTKKQKIPFYKFKNSQVEGTPGGMCIIPKMNILKIEYLGWVSVPWRE